MAKSPSSSVFLSHNSKDKPFVRRLASALNRRGFRCWVDESEIRIGDSLIGKISDAIERIDFVVAVISRSSVDSSWVRQELDWAMTKEIGDRRVVVLPVVIDRCDIPFFLRSKLYADFTDAGSFDGTVERLIDSLRHHGGGAGGSSFSPAPVVGGTVTRSYRPTWVPAAVSVAMIFMGVLMLAGSRAYFGGDLTPDLSKLAGNIDAFCFLLMAVGCVDIIRILFLVLALRADPALAQDVGSVSVSNMFSGTYRRIIRRHRRNWLFMVVVGFEAGVWIAIPALVMYAVKIGSYL